MVVVALGLFAVIACGRLLKSKDGLQSHQVPAFQMLDVTGGWKIHTGDDLSWAAPSLDETSWRTVEVGKSWETQGLSEYNGYAWYRLRFRIPGALKRHPDYRQYQALILDLGFIDDVDETWCNGERIGATGSFPRTYATAWDTRRVYRIPARLIQWDDDNVLAVRVYDGGGPGGLYQGPYSIRLPVWTDHFTVRLDPGHGDGIFPEKNAMTVAAVVHNQAPLDVYGNLRWIFESDERQALATSSTGLAVRAGKSVAIQSNFEPSTPGFYRVTGAFESAADDRSVSTSMILGYAPEAIHAPLTRRADFDAFWQTTLGDLREINPQFRMIPQPEGQSETHNVHIVEMRSLGNVLVRGWYEAPKKPGPHPAILRLPGYGAGLEPLRTSDTVVVFSFNPRGHGNSQDDVSGRPADFWIRGLDNKHDYFYRGAYMDCVRAVDFLASRQEVDPKRIAVTGASQGGGLSLIAAGLDRRISLCAPEIPFLCNFAKYFRCTHWPEMDQWIAARPERSWAEMLRTLSYFDALNFAPEVQCPVFLGVGLQDAVCPASTIFAVHNRLPGHKEYRVYLHAGHDLSGTDHELQKRTWLRRQFGRPD